MKFFITTQAELAVFLVEITFISARHLWLARLQLSDPADIINVQWPAKGTRPFLWLTNDVWEENHNPLSRENHHEINLFSWEEMNEQNAISWIALL